MGELTKKRKEKRKITREVVPRLKEDTVKDTKGVQLKIGNTIEIVNRFTCFSINFAKCSQVKERLIEALPSKITTVTNSEKLRPSIQPNKEETKLKSLTL